MEKHKLSADIVRAIHDRLPEDELRLAICSDITLQGEYGETWLVATDKHLLTVEAPAGAETIAFCKPFAEIAKVRAVNLVGCGAVDVEAAGGVHRVVVFSRAVAGDFHQTVDGIEHLIEGKAIVAKHVTPSRETCGSCGRRIPESAGRCPYCIDRRQTMLRLLEFSRPYAGKIALICLFMLLATGVGLATPWITKLFIDYVFLPGGGDGIYQFRVWHVPLVLVLLLSYVAECIFAGIQERLAGTIGFRTVYDVRAAVYEKVQRLSLSFFDKHQTGSILARVNQDTAELQRLLVDFIPMACEGALMLIGVGVLLFVLSWSLTLYVLIPIGLTVVFLKLFIPTLRSYFHRYFHRRSRVSALVSDTLSGIRVVKAFGQEMQEIGKFDRRSTSYRDSGIDLVRKWTVFHPVLHFLIMSGTAIVWYVGGRLIFRGTMSMGDVVAYSGYLAMFYRPMFMLTRLAHMITSALSAAERVFEVIDAEPDVRDAQHPVAVGDLKGEVELRNVTFGYTKFQPVINGMSVKIRENEIVGLVGKSGGGKSTTASLICRLYDVDEGAVLVDGTDVRELDQYDLRRHIGVVLQETFLFNGSILENIAYARPGATKEQVIDAAMAAHAHEFIIKKPDGYDTIVGERGGRLSGGEKQRVAIARAILKDPRILILDEATSSVDVHTERKIQEALENLTRSRTTIAIAHRLSTLRSCDRLLVVDDGRIVEMGSHAELMEKKGVFHELATTQEQLSAIIAVDG